MPFPACLSFPAPSHQTPCTVIAQKARVFSSTCMWRPAISHYVACRTPNPYIVALEQGNPGFPTPLNMSIRYLSVTSLRALTDISHSHAFPPQSPKPQPNTDGTKGAHSRHRNSPGDPDTQGRLVRCQNSCWVSKVGGVLNMDFARPCSCRQMVASRDTLR